MFKHQGSITLNQNNHCHFFPIVSFLHTATRMVAGAALVDATAMGTSPLTMPTTGVMAVMSSPQWAAAGSDIEAEEDNDIKAEKQSGTNSEGMQDDKEGAGIRAANFVESWLAEHSLSGEDAAMIVQLDKTFDAIVNACK